MAKRKAKSPDRLLDSGVAFGSLIVTFKTPEHPNEIQTALLSDILEDAWPASCVLTTLHARKMLGRLQRYGKQDGTLGKALQLYIDTHPE